MLLTLLKKDYLIIKKYVWIMLFIAVFIPPMMRWRAPEFNGALGFILAVIFSVLILLQYLLLKDYEFPKATALLCTAPFTRNQLVLSRYIFCIAIYIICCGIFKIEALLFPQLGTANIPLFVIMFFIIAVFISIYMPVQYKLGYEKTKLFFVLICSTSPVLLPALMRMTADHDTMFLNVPSYIVYGSIFVMGLIILAISLFLSMRIFKKKDLK